MPLKAVDPDTINNRKWAMSDLSSLQVLIVDDNHHMCEIISSILYSINIKNIKEAETGPDAINIMINWKPDIIIIDYLMAPVDGIAFARSIRSDISGHSALVPIIMMTGNSQTSKVIEARDAGVTEFMSKPISAKVVLDRIQSVIFHPRSMRAPTTISVLIAAVTGRRVLPDL